MANGCALRGLLGSKASVGFTEKLEESLDLSPPWGAPSLFGFPGPGPPSKGLTAFSTCSCILKTRN